MSRLIGACALAFVVAASSSAAKDVASPPQIRQFDVATIEKLGQDIYAQDQEAWKATDVLRAQYSDDDLKAASLHGWITETADGHDIVRFIHIGTSGAEAFCDVSFDNGAPGSHCITPQTTALNADEKAQYNARVLAIKNVDRPCSQRYNSVALKDPESDRWLVWALASTTEPGVIVDGGHYRFTISRDGTSIVQKDALSRGCMNTPPPDPSKGREIMEAFFQLVSNTPVETAVWLNLQHKIPFMLITPDRTEWLIDNGHVTISGKLGDATNSTGGK